MTNQELYRIIDLPDEVIYALEKYGKARTVTISSELASKLIRRSSWDDAIKELNALIGEDENGIGILWELLELVCKYTYPEYKRREIPDKIFADTMHWCTRYVNEHKQKRGYYAFTMAWWFPRLLSLNEFRIGTFSYEFIDGGKREISLHIPSDGSLAREDIFASIKDFLAFLKSYYPDWCDVPIVCNTWMLSPALEELLDGTSRILAFKNMFEIDKTDPDATWFMEYIFPGYSEVGDSLPEKTSLQRRLKKHLLEGKRLGSAKGHLKDEFRRNL